MAKGTRVLRSSAKDVDVLNKAIRSFNDKIVREVKKNPVLKEYVPEKLNFSTEWAKARNMTRAEFNRKLTEYGKIFTKDAFKKVDNVLGLKVIKYEVKKVEKAIKIENEKRAIRREANKENYLKGISDEESNHQLKPIQDNVRIKSPDDFNVFAQKMEVKLSSAYDRERLGLYKDNYLQAMDNVGSFSREFYQAVINTPAEKLFNLRKQHPEMEITYLYNDREREEKEDMIMELLGQSKDEMDFDYSAGED